MLFYCRQDNKSFQFGISLLCDLNPIDFYIEELQPANIKRIFFIGKWWLEKNQSDKRCYILSIWRYN